MRVAGVRFVLREVIELVLLDPFELAVAHRIRDRDRTALLAVAGDGAVDEDDFGRIDTGEGRRGHCTGEARELLANVFGCSQYRMRARCSHPGTVLDGSLRQGRVGELDANVLDRQPE